MGSQGAGSDQAGIGPGEGFLQNSSITVASKLGSPTAWWCQSTVEADGQHQADPGPRQPIGLIELLTILLMDGQSAATVSSDAGVISSWGASA